MEGRDFQIHHRMGRSGILVIAPHGGGIEPGTTEIAKAVAGDDHAYYSFDGMKRQRCLDLHITSKHFDEPICLGIVQDSETIVAIHGCRGEDCVVFLGGRDGTLKEMVWDSLERACFLVRENPRFPGASPTNICNRSRSGRGVQLELSLPLRRLMFKDLSKRANGLRTDAFHGFVGALREALAEHEILLGEKGVLERLMGARAESKFNPIS